MDKETFQKKWYFRLLQIVFWMAFIFFLLLGIWGIFYEDDMPLVSFVYAGIVAIVYLGLSKIIKKWKAIK